VFALLTLSVGGSLFGAMFHVSNHVVIGAFAIASAIAAVAARDLSSDAMIRIGTAAVAGGTRLDA
jgi:hypothetical protein